MQILFSGEVHCHHQPSTLSAMPLPCGGGIFESGRDGAVPQQWEWQCEHTLELDYVGLTNLLHV